MTAAYTDKDIQDYVKGTWGAKAWDQGAGKFAVNDDVTARSIYDIAKARGVTAEQVDRALGWKSGTSQGWIERQGLPGISTPAPPPSWMTAPPPTAAGISAPPPPMPTPAPAAQSTAATAAAPASTAPPPPAPNPWDSILGTLQAQNQALMDKLNQPRAPAQQVTFDESKGVAGRTQAITADPNSPLMRQAASQGRRDANSRGVLNSSAGVRAAQDAMIARAADIAAADANLYSNTQLANMREANAWESQGLDRDLQQLVSGQNNALGYARLGQEGEQFNAKIASDERMFDKRLTADESQFGRRLSEDARQFDTTNARELRIADMNFNLQDRRLSQDDRQFLADLGLQQRKVDTQIEQFAKQFGLSAEQLELDKGRLSQQDKQFYDQLQMDRARLDQQGRQFEQEWSNRFSLEKMSNAARIDLAKLDGDIRRDLIGVEATYKKDIASNENISNAWGTMMQEIGRIQNNPDLEPAAKNTLISNATDSFKSFTNFWRKVNGSSVDVSDLLSFGPAGGASTNAGGTGSGSGSVGDRFGGSTP